MGKQFTKSWSKWDYIYDIPIELQIPIKDRPFIEKGLDRLNLQQLSLLYNSIRDNRLDKYLNEEDWVDMKEKISATIFDYDCGQGTNYNRPDEEDCNAIAELIMERLGYKLLLECFKCKQLKSFDEFNEHHYHDGDGPYCSICHNQLLEKELNDA